MKRVQETIVCGALAFFTTLPMTASAHHGWSGYETEIRKVTGVIEQMSYSNPHGSIHLKAEDKTWVIVLAPPSRMTARGLTQEMLKTGAQVAVEGYEHSSDKTEMRAERITVDGKTVELR